ncbi:hypothetical protein Tco_1327668 [Tanacetum coccineum]
MANTDMPLLRELSRAADSRDMRDQLSVFFRREVAEILRKCTIVVDDDVVVLENSETKEEDVKEDESDHNKERYTFEDDDDDGEFDDLD